MKQKSTLKKYVNLVIDRVLLPALTIGSLAVSGALGFLQPPMNQIRLEKILEEEKRKLGIGDNIELVLGKTPIPRAFAEIEPVADEYGEVTGYKITLDEMRNRFAIRHELYHEEDEHLSYPPTPINKLKAEFQANIYALTGLKL